MFRLFLLAASFALSVQVNAQINRPRTTPNAPVPRSTESRNLEPSPKENNGSTTTKAYDVDIKLLSVEGNVSSQKVTITWLLNNPKANLQAFLRDAYAVDPDGNEYKDASGGTTSSQLFTDIPKRETRTLAGVPAKIKSFKLLKVDFFTSVTRRQMMVEFRDVPIDWK